MRSFRPIDVEAARAKYEYDPATGIIKHRKRTSGRIKPDLVAGIVTVNANGPTARVFWNGQNLPAGRMAWVLHYGEDPGAMMIRYKNHDQTDVRIANLQLTDPSLLGRGKRAKRTSISGLKGASWNSAMGLFEARMKTPDCHVSLGQFRSAEEAHDVYVRASERRFGAHFADGTARWQDDAAQGIEAGTGETHSGSTATPRKPGP